MDLILFFVNILLICLCSATLGISLLTHQKTKQPFYLYCALLTVCFIVEFVVLQYVCSDIYFSGLEVNSEILNHISFKYVRVITYLLILLLEFLCMLWITKIHWKKKFIFLFLPALILYTVLIFSEQTLFVIWFFYSIRQFYQFGYLIFFIYCYFTMEDPNQKRKLGRFTPIMTGIFFLNCSVLIEDTSMISHIKSLLFESPWMSERNFTENLLWLFLCYCIIYLCSHRLGECDSTKPDSEPSNIETFTNTETTETHPVSGPLLQNLPAFSRYYKLTPREIEILKCLIQCQQTSEICEELHISTGTVKTHIHNIYMKLEINTRTELMKALSEFSEENI